MVKSGVKKTINKRGATNGNHKVGAPPQFAGTKNSTKSRVAPISLVPRSGIATTGLAQIGNRGNGNIRVRHREYFADVLGTTVADFQVTQYSVNPGVPSMFPWLASVAARFEKYTFHKLCVTYLPSCSVTTVGTVMAAFDTDAADEAPAAKVQLMAYQNAARSPPWGEWVVDCPLIDSKGRYVRRGGNPANTDIKTYDIANFFVAQQATAATGQLGELYVDYDVTLEVPQLIDLASSATAISNPGALLTGPFVSAFFAGTLTLFNTLPLTTNGQLALRCFVGQSFLLAVDLKGVGITSLSVSFPIFAGSVVTLLGPVSQTVAATSATYAVAIRVDGVVANQTGISSGNNGAVLILITATGTSLSNNGATLSISPWQSALPFP